MNKKEWKEVTKKMIESFPTDTLIDGKLEDKVIVIYYNLYSNIFYWILIRQKK